ncbi:hypothetical protein ABZX75_24820 [Streptomyces sp. NPDC003038]|uniref:hypothetical protein n=1 Tax=unclassified Streptomyces TaxID=2593676 RepID=UPI0033A06185
MLWTDHRTRCPRPAFWAVAAVCAALLCGGCAGHSAPHDGAGTRGAETPEDRQAGTGPASIEAIATVIGCTAEVNVQAEELREGGCVTEQGAYRMVTFAAAEGLRAWLTEARNYGGSYLVGDRWVVTTPSADALTALRARLGGSLENGDAHDTHDAPDGHTPHPGAAH